MLVARSKPMQESEDSSGQKQAEPAAPKFGVAIFDNPKLSTTGWCCLPGDSPSRFSSLAELSNSAIWITSLDYEEFVAKGKQHHHLRRNDYLRTSLKQIGDDLGFQLEGAFAQETSRILAQVFARTMHITVKSYGWKDPLQALREGLLYEDLRRCIANAPETKEHMASAFESAYQSYSTPTMSSPFESNSVFVQLRRNRLHHAREILGTLVPDEGWRFDPGAGSRSLDYWLDPEHPSLVEATVELSGADPDIAALIAFGAAPTGSRGVLRKWISQPELRWMSRHARIQVSSGYIATASRSLPQEAQLPAAMTSDPLFGLSYSAGLVAECHWNAYASQPWRRIKGKETRSWAVWLRAVDRAICFQMALQAWQAGFHVGGYGNGAVMVRVSRERLVELESFAEGVGASYPSFSELKALHGIKSVLAGDSYEN